MYYDANITFRILVKIIQAYGVGAQELGILPAARAQIKNKEPEPEFSWKFRTGAGVMAIWEVAPVSSEISYLCEICDLLLFFSYFASQNKEIKSGNYVFDVRYAN